MVYFDLKFSVAIYEFRLVGSVGIFAHTLHPYSAQTAGVPFLGKTDCIKNISPTFFFLSFPFHPLFLSLLPPVVYDMVSYIWFNQN
jgi:hypothetical protein